MAHEITDGSPSTGTKFRRRTLLGAALAVGVVVPLLGTGTAHADSSGDSEEYPIPDETGSAPWW